MANAVEPKDERAQRRTSRWLPLAVSVTTAGFVIAIAYVGIQYVRNSTSSDDRAFRVLAQMVEQFGNLERALGAVLISSDPRAQSKLAFPGEWRMESAAADQPEACRNPKTSWEVDVRSMARDLVLTKRTEAPKCRVGRLHGSLTALVPQFMHQEFFDTVVVASAAGSVLVAISGSPDQLDGSGPDGVPVLIANAQGILRHAATQEALGDKPWDPQSKRDESQQTPSHPIVLTDKVAGHAYRVFVHVFEPVYPVTLSVAEQKSPGEPPGDRLFLIGLKRQAVLQGSIDALGSRGLLTITLVTILAILGWPLIGLKFASPQEGFSAAQVLAVVIALLVIPAALTAAGFAIWSRYRLTVWADLQAEVYARQVENALLQEVDVDLRILDRLAASLSSQGREQESFVAPDNLERNLICIEPTCAPEQSSPIAHSEFEFPAHWWPLRSGVALNLDGESRGYRFGFFAPASVELLALGDREYFQSIRNGTEWRPDEIWVEWNRRKWPETTKELRSPTHGYYAQRLVNRSDAARALQLAVPIPCTEPRCTESIAGVVTADTRAYALTTAIRPPLMRFAVIDGRGDVLFHSDDTRSLAENLVLETEQNASLRESMRRAASPYSLNRVEIEHHFSAPYLGEKRRFYYRPVSGMPWGIVVFYSAESLSDIVLQTAIATISTYFAGAALLILLFALFVLIAPGRADIHLLATLWPRWSHLDRYRLIAAFGAPVAAAVTTMVVHTWSRDAGSILALVASLLVGVATYVAIQFARRARRSRRGTASESLAAYQNWYVCCLVVAMWLLAVPVTIWLARSYHDTAVEVFMRSELQQAASNIVQRRRTIANDLRRFVAGANYKRADANEVSHYIPAPGFSSPLLTCDRTIWELSHVQPGLWLSPERTVLGVVRRTIWNFSTPGQARRGYRATGVGADRAAVREGCGVSGSTAPALSGERYRGVRYRMPGDHGETILVAMPVPAQAASNAESGLLTRGDELQFRPMLSLMLMVLLFGLGLLILTLLAWHVATRLLGIRRPFVGRYLEKHTNALDMKPLIEAEFRLNQVRELYGLSFTDKDEADWRAIHCQPLYEHLWSSLSGSERLLVHQLAKGRFANPANRLPIESLIRRGFLKLSPWPRIVPTGFAEYLRASETEHDFAQLQREASRNVWQRIRTPLLILVVVIAGLMLWLAGSAMQILTTTLAGVAALLGSVTQVAGFARSGTTSSAAGK
jgi:hypothetical protein